jgi:hypothetical protein
MQLPAGLLQQRLLAGNPKATLDMLPLNHLNLPLPGQDTLQPINHGRRRFEFALDCINFM